MQSLLAAAAERVQVSMPIYTDASHPQLTFWTVKIQKVSSRTWVKGMGLTTLVVESAPFASALSWFVLFILS